MAVLVVRRWQVSSFGFLESFFQFFFSFLSILHLKFKVANCCSDAEYESYHENGHIWRSRVFMVFGYSHPFLMI